MQMRSLIIAQGYYQASETIPTTEFHAFYTFYINYFQDTTSNSLKYHLIPFSGDNVQGSYYTLFTVVN